MFIIGLGTALPATRYTQVQCWEALTSWERLNDLTPRSRATLKKVLLSQNGVVSRHLALPVLTEAFAVTPDVLHARFSEHAPALATEAAAQALRHAQCEPAEIDALIVSTCTGYLCPGLTSYVTERLGLRADVLPLDLVGQGCGAALPNLRMADALVASGRCRRVMSVCVEVCSAAFYVDDDPGVLISACLFGDAAGAAVLADAPISQGRRVEWTRSESFLDPAHRDLLRFEQRNGMLRNILTPPVPLLAAQHAAKLFREVAHQAGVKKKEIANWIFHAGGRDVLVALRQEFDLTDNDLQWSASVLRELGNVSSPFVFHVMERALAKGQGGWWWMSSFGAGFSCHGALLAVE
ncbi:MAG TPA: stilbene synthase [Verrucomicrobiae bacterium]|nr:stilbene synthase [Verrucomicrobiae bacterium]